jgi:hypothetical protein
MRSTKLFSYLTAECGFRKDPKTLAQIHRMIQRERSKYRKECLEIIEGFLAEQKSLVEHQ